MIGPLHHEVRILLLHYFSKMLTRCLVGSEGAPFVGAHTLNNNPRTLHPGYPVPPGMFYLLTCCLVGLPTRSPEYIREFIWRRASSRFASRQELYDEAFARLAESHLVQCPSCPGPDFRLPTR